MCDGLSYLYFPNTFTHTYALNQSAVKIDKMILMNCCNICLCAKKNTQTKCGDITPANTERKVLGKY